MNDNDEDKYQNASDEIVEQIKRRAAEGAYSPESAERTIKAFQPEVLAEVDELFRNLIVGTYDDMFQALDEEKALGIAVCSIAQRLEVLIPELVRIDAVVLEAFKGIVKITLALREKQLRAQAEALERDKVARRLIESAFSE